MTTPEKSYIPNPLDVSDIEIPERLKPLIEIMARNVHDTWAQGRLNEGWTLGPKRDDALKQHPCLIPYDDLPENEKDYDHHTAIGTLKTILKLGWKIEENETL